MYARQMTISEKISLWEIRKAHFSQFYHYIPSSIDKMKENK
jgi:hypothetical protein